VLHHTARLSAAHRLQQQQHLPPTPETGSKDEDKEGSELKPHCAYLAASKTAPTISRIIYFAGRVNSITPSTGVSLFYLLHQSQHLLNSSILPAAPFALSPFAFLSFYTADHYLYHFYAHHKPFIALIY
jgi:hypothetical protein